MDLLTVDNLIVGNLITNLGPSFASFTSGALTNWAAEDIDVTEMSRRLSTFVDSLQRAPTTALSAIRPILNRGNSNKRQRQGTVSGKKSLINPCTDPHCQKDSHEALTCFYKDPSKAPQWWREKKNNQASQSEHLKG